MKTLFVVRHGKSSWENAESDHERTLQERGFKDAELVINELLKKENLPKTIFSSSAVRAKTTAKLFQEKLAITDKNFSIIEDLYTFDYKKLKKCIHNLPENTDDLIIFGHNPGFTELVNDLGDYFLPNLPTTGLVKINFDSDSWKTIQPGKVEYVIFPKHLR
ncbi:MAG: SixA phosphatase family protein [Bacteroidota bacterium]